MSRLILLLFIAVGLYGCGAAALPVDTPTQAPVDSPVPAATRPPAGVTPLLPLATLVPGGSSVTDGLVGMARADMVKQFGIQEGAISVVKVEAREWPDSSLGCPQPGMMYSQVITPGYLIVLSANGKQYEYHASRTNVILCNK